MESLKKFLKENNIAVLFAVIFMSAFFAQTLFASPADFPASRLFTIEKGWTLSEVASHLKENNIIRSENIFVFLVQIMGLEREIKSGDYFFEEPNSVFGVVKRFVSADFGLDSIRVTVPEGATIKDISEIFSKFDNFNKDNFIEIAEGKEGYLFPDTYFFLPNSTEELILNTMEETFREKVGDIDYNMLKMASLIEKEVSDHKDRRIVSGILWNRLEVGMPLQVDAVFPYIIGKNSHELTLDDLKIDSPYNTYLYRGLPPRPICNPGLDAIDAALNPQKNGYWYYLSDNEGNTYFAETFEEHKANKQKYLR